MQPVVVFSAFLRNQQLQIGSKCIGKELGWPQWPELPPGFEEAPEHIKVTITKPENDKSVLRCVKGHPGMPTNNFTKWALTQKLLQIQGCIVPHFKAETVSGQKRHDTLLYFSTREGKTKHAKISCLVQTRFSITSNA